MLPTISRGMEAFGRPIPSSGCELLFFCIIHPSNDCVQVFLFATNEISTNKIPLIHQVIPIFDVITTVLEDNIKNDALPLIVRHAALWGYYMLNKYYSFTDDSVVYRIAMSMTSALL